MNLKSWIADKSSSTRFERRVREAAQLERQRMEAAHMAVRTAFKCPDEYRALLGVSVERRAS